MVYRFNCSVMETQGQQGKKNVFLTVRCKMLAKRWQLGSDHGLTVGQVFVNFVFAT